MSRFKVYKNQPFSTLIDKIIEKLEEIKFPDDYDIYISSHLYQISFENSNEPFQFVLIIYSNGYYDGWIKIEKN